MKIDKKLNVILTTLGLVIVGLVVFTIFKADSSARNSNDAESSRISKQKRSKKDMKSKQEKNSDSDVRSQKADVATNSEINKNPNAGKILKFNSVEEAEKAIKQHETTCPYESEPFYPGLVYTGTYTCKCGLKIIWWDKTVKESVDKDMASFSREGITGPEEYSFGTDDPWENNLGKNDTQTSNSEATDY
jgi:hypothetical protein